jgi:diguanylate cyclase (GGDEF)-like protein
MTTTETKQALRLRRFFMAVATYVFCAILGQVCAWLGYLPPWFPVWWAIGVAVVNGFFYFLLQSGQNLRFKDPSMTEAQLIFSMFAAMAIISVAREARGAFLIFLPVPMLFGALRLNFWQMARVGFIGLLGYACVIAVNWHQQPERVKISLEILYLLSLASVMIFVCLMCGYISNIREKLSSAVATINELARRDSLTGLFNRRDLMEKLDIEMARCKRKLRSGLTLCLVDVDHFKSINDKFGHPVGDDVLKLCGTCLLDSVRTTDYVARYGGEEFVLVLDADSEDLALQTCERVRKQVEQIRVETLADFSISVSVGVAHLIEGESVAGLIARADLALYEAKANGRNCVCVAPRFNALTDADLIDF